MTVVPVSLLHSANVAAEKLGGQGAELLEPALMKFAETGGSRAVLLPLFFGPSGALTDYLPDPVAIPLLPDQGSCLFGQLG